MHQGTTEVTGIVTKCLPNTLFKVVIDGDNDKKEILCHLSGKMRINYIRILPGDNVKVEMTPYDKDKGRIIFRLKK